MKVLIAEDNDINQQLIVLYMRKMGWEYVMVANGLDVLKALGRNNQDNFDAVLMDIDMPVVNGIDAAMQIRTMYEAIPLIAITAYADESMRDDCAEAGFNAFLSKPCSREDIKAVIIECVQLSTMSPSALA